MAASTASGWSDGIVEGSLVMAEAAVARGGVPAAVEAATSAVEEAVRTGLPLWRAYRGAAGDCRAAGDEERAAGYAAEAERAFAQVLERIHDRDLRDT